MNPFASHALALSDPPTDALPVMPDDATDLTRVAIALNVETGGTVAADTVAGNTRTIAVADYSIAGPQGARPRKGFMPPPVSVRRGLVGQGHAGSIAREWLT